MNTWIFPSMLASLISSLLLMLVYSYLYYQEQKPYLRIWSIAWLFYSLRYTFGVMNLVTEGSDLLLMLDQFSALVSGAFLVWGTYVFLGRRFPRAWIYLTFAGFVWIVTTIYLKSSFILITIPTFAFLGIIMVWTGWAFARTKWLDITMRNVVGWAFILWGLHKLDYPFLRPIAWFAPWGFMFGSLLALVIAIGIILLYFKIAKSDLMLYQFALDSTEDEVFLINPEGQFEYANRKACATLGYTRDEMLGIGVPDIDPLYDASKMEGHIDSIKARGHMRFESVHMTKAGVKYPVEILANFVQYGGREYNLAFARDITERREAEGQLINSLKEKDVLLAELHHRVKNNMAIILSLLRMQSAQITDEAAAEVLRDSQSRIRSMALVHEKLYKAGNLSQIDAKDYFTALARDIQATHGGLKAAGLELNLDSLFMSIDDLIPCGLIINELLTNAFKYGLKGVQHPQITIGLRMQGADIELSVADNGVGLQVGIELDRGGGLGFKLVQVLANQISAKVTIERSGGTKFTFVFPESVE